MPGVDGVVEPEVQPGFTPHEHTCVCHGIDHMSTRPKRWRAVTYPFQLKQVHRDHEYTKEVNGYIADVRKYRTLTANQAADYRADCIDDQLTREKRERETSSLRLDSALSQRERRALILSERIAGQVAVVNALAGSVQKAENSRDSAFDRAFENACKGYLVAGFENLRGIKEQRIYDGCKHVAWNERLELEEMECFNYAHLYHQVYYVYIIGVVRDLKKRLENEHEEIFRLRVEQARFHGDVDVEPEVIPPRRSSLSQ